MFARFKQDRSSAQSSGKAPSQAASASRDRRAPLPLLGTAATRGPDEDAADQSSRALREQISAVVESLNQTGRPPPGVRQGGLQGKTGVYGNKSGALPVKPEGYYKESDVWPGPGPRKPERIVVGGPGEAWYSSDHYGTFKEWPW